MLFFFNLLFVSFPYLVFHFYLFIFSVLKFPSSLRQVSVFKYQNVLYCVVKVFYTVVYSWHTVTCTLIGVPKYCGKHGLSSLNRAPGLFLFPETNSQSKSSSSVRWIKPLIKLLNGRNGKTVMHLIFVLNSVNGLTAQLLSSINGKYFLPYEIKSQLQVHFWRRKWQSTPVLLPGKSHGQRRLVGYSPRGCKESDTTKRLHFTIGIFGYILEKVMTLFFSKLFFSKIRI